MIWVGATLGLYARTTETANVIGFMIHLRQAGRPGNARHASRPRPAADPYAVLSRRRERLLKASNVKSQDRRQAEQQGGMRVTGDRTDSKPQRALPRRRGRNSRFACPSAFAR